MVEKDAHAPNLFGCDLVRPGQGRTLAQFQHSHRMLTRHVWIAGKELVERGALLENFEQDPTGIRVPANTGAPPSRSSTRPSGHCVRSRTLWPMRPIIV